MNRNTRSALVAGITLATLSMAPTVAFAQFPGGPPPIGPGGPPPIGAGGPPALGGPPPMGPVGASRAGFGGPAPRLGAGAAPGGDLKALGDLRAADRGGSAVIGSARSASVSISRSGGYGGSTYGYRTAAYAAGAYAAGVYSGSAYGRSSYEYDSGSSCYYVYRRHRRLVVCD
jgi:hypothetical protein